MSAAAAGRSRMGYDSPPGVQGEGLADALPGIYDGMPLALQLLPEGAGSELAARDVSVFVRRLRVEGSGAAAACCAEDAVELVVTEDMLAGPAPDLAAVVARLVDLEVVACLSAWRCVCAPGVRLLAARQGIVHMCGGGGGRLQSCGASCRRIRRHAPLSTTLLRLAAASLRLGLTPPWQAEFVLAALPSSSVALAGDARLAGTVDWLPVSHVLQGHSGAAGQSDARAGRPAGVKEGAVLFLRDSREKLPPSPKTGGPERGISISRGGPLPPPPAPGSFARGPPPPPPAPPRPAAPPPPPPPP